jgi:hypothetical protein
VESMENILHRALKDKSHVLKIFILESSRNGGVRSNYLNLLAIMAAIPHQTSNKFLAAFPKRDVPASRVRPTVDRSVHLGSSKT